MTNKLGSLDALRNMRLFAEIVAAGSFRGAAERLGIPVSTVSRRLVELEREIGLQLINRTTRRMYLTDSGKLYLSRCNAILSDVERTYQDLEQIKRQPTGVLRISVAADFALSYLEPYLTEFAQLHPALKFSLDLSPQLIDLAASDIDVALRMGRPINSTLIARPLLSLPARLFASPDYLARCGTPQAPAELSQHDCLQFKSGDWALQHDLTSEVVKVTVSGRFQVNNPSMQVRLATRGFGIIRLPEVVLRSHVKDGSLRAVLPLWHGDSVTVHALTTTRSLPARTRLFLDFLSQRMRADQPPVNLLSDQIL